METFTNQPLPIGGMIQEFRIVRVLGAGAFGIVYLCENTFLPEKAAIKEFLPMDVAGRLSDGEVRPLSEASEGGFLWARDRFLQVAKTPWDLGHPNPHRNIVRVTRFCEANGTAYMSMAFERGRPLSTLLEERDTLPYAELKQIIFPLLDGLERVHEAEVVHRDIKPANILIRSDGSPVLIDFGAARQAIGGERSVMSAFTPNYAALEQVHAVGEQGPWTDIYALGATLYRAISGKPPPNVAERAVGAAQVSAVRIGHGTYPDTFLAAIDAACEVKPKSRPQSVSEWRRMLVKGPGKSAPIQATTREPAPASESDQTIADDGATQLPPHTDANQISRPDRGEASTTESAAEQTGFTVFDTGADTGVDLNETIMPAPPIHREAPPAQSKEISEESPGKNWIPIVLAVIVASTVGIWLVAGEKNIWIAEKIKTIVAGDSDSVVSTGIGEGTETGADAKPPPKIVKPGDRFRDPFLDTGAGPPMVWLPPGTFQMGSPASEPGRNSDELLHRAEVRAMIAVGETEVTVGQFGEFVEETSYRSEIERETSCLRMDDAGERIIPDLDLSWRTPGFDASSHHPLTCVSWNDARAYADWLSVETGHEYRLPTELEWEYAARAGSNGGRHWGDDPNTGCKLSNTADSTVISDSDSESQFVGPVTDCRDNFVFTAPVGFWSRTNSGCTICWGTWQSGPVPSTTKDTRAARPVVSTKWVCPRAARASSVAGPGWMRQCWSALRPETGVMRRSARAQSRRFNAAAMLCTTSSL